MRTAADHLATSNGHARRMLMHLRLAADAARSERSFHELSMLHDALASVPRTITGHAMLGRRHDRG